MNFIDYQLDVLASSPAEINQIDGKLNESGYTVVHNLGYVHPSVNKSRRFESTTKDGHLHMDSAQRVSEEFPEAVFLLAYQDPQWSYSGKCVIQGGKVIRHIHDGEQQAQAQDWTLLDIFAPFRAEYSRELAVGSLWERWVNDVITAANGLKEGASDPGLSIKKVEEDAFNAQVAAVRAVEKFLESKIGPKH